MSFENLLFKLLPRHILYRRYPLGTCMEELIKPSFQAKTGTHRLFLILIIDLSVPLDLKENFTLKYLFSQKIHPF